MIGKGNEPTAISRPSPRIRLIIPCFNEARANDYCLVKTASIFLQTLDDLTRTHKCSAKSCICYVDDGSSDDTWDVICRLADQHPNIAGIKLSRNFGHHNALLAGLLEARGRCDAAVSLDCDGQDDPMAIGRMLDEFARGSDIVYGVRSSRDTDSFFKHKTAEAYYALLKSLGADIKSDHADYRLISSRGLEALAEFGETNLFLRGLVPLIGLPSSIIEYERTDRRAGRSRYPLKKMLALAMNGITSLSVKPIRIISGLGLAFSSLGLLGAVWTTASFMTGNAVAGWASTLCFVSLIGGLQLLCLGVIGEYIGKIYLETKGRPRYIVEQQLTEKLEGDADADSSH